MDTLFAHKVINCLFSDYNGQLYLPLPFSHSFFSLQKSSPWLGQEYNFILFKV